MERKNYQNSLFVIIFFTDYTLHYCSMHLEYHTLIEAHSVVAKDFSPRVTVSARPGCSRKEPRW